MQAAAQTVGQLDCSLHWPHMPILLQFYLQRSAPDHRVASLLVTLWSYSTLQATQSAAGWHLQGWHHLALALYSSVRPLLRSDRLY